MNITKKEFMDALTSKKSYFAGIVRKDYNADEIDCQLADLWQGDHILEFRTCTSKGLRLNWCNGSALLLNDTPYQKNTCKKYVLTGAVDYILKQVWRDDIDNTEHVKCMHYLVFNS